MGDEFISFDRKTKYGTPPGRCIYCGSGGGGKGLRDEHIIAFSLGMDAYLPNASCADCEAITSYLDGYAGKHIYGPLRLRMRIQSRRGKVKLRDISVEFNTVNGKEVRMIPAEEYPTFLALPVLHPPSILFSTAPGPIIPKAGWVWHLTDYEEKMKLLERPGDTGSVFDMKINLYPFGRMLAKVAHTFAAARLGIDSFKPYLPDFILGKNPMKGAQLIGGDGDPTPGQPYIPPGKQIMHHQMQLYMLASHNKPTLLAMSIKLFTFTGAPSYQVIVGEAGQSAIEQLSNADGKITP